MCVCFSAGHRFRERESVCSPVRLFATPWTVVHQAPLSMGFSGQKYWSGLPFPPPGDLHNPGIEPSSPARVSCSGGWILNHLSHLGSPASSSDKPSSPASLTNRCFATGKGDQAVDVFFSSDVEGVPELDVSASQTLFPNKERSPACPPKTECSLSRLLPLPTVDPRASLWKEWGPREGALRDL